ncbi:Spo12 [Neofusicoccum parvum]|uniref:Spo12-like protein n=3 Tax=Neofusicoccum TaxID=407951 RepID=A0ABR3ST39_9PEZI|nr:putative spo12-like protein [Neofusicoccum parvum UCRNP2]GME28996.1 Spo12 [Neofusicoccum parvum]GME46572.1 Spo12 [Neofusicoccum parvum]
MSANVLAARDANAQLNQTVDDGKTKSLEYHRQVLESRMKSGQMDEQKYVSPSDGIQSPATQKLAAFKNKHGLQKSKPKTLFGKMSARNMENAASGGFADIPQNSASQASNQSS